MASFHSTPRSEKAQLARGPTIDMHDVEFEAMMAKSDHRKDFPTSWFTATAVSGVATVVLLFGRNHMASAGKEAFGFGDWNSEWFQFRILWPTVLSSLFAVANLALVKSFKRSIPAPLVFLNACALSLGSYTIMSSLYQILIAEDEPTMHCPLGLEGAELFVDCMSWNHGYRHYLAIYLLCAATHGVLCACLCLMQFVTAILATVRLLVPKPCSVCLGSSAQR